MKQLKLKWWIFILASLGQGCNCMVWFGFPVSSLLFLVSTFPVPWSRWGGWNVESIHTDQPRKTSWSKKHHCGDLVPKKYRFISKVVEYGTYLIFHRVSWPSLPHRRLAPAVAVDKKLWPTRRRCFLFLKLRWSFPECFQKFITGLCSTPNDGPDVSKAVQLTHSVK